MNSPIFMRNTPAMYGGLVDMCVAVRNLFPQQHLTVVEVGSYSGEGSEILFENLQNCTLHCIDPWQSGYDPNDPASSTDMVAVESRFDRWASKFTGVYKHKGVSQDFAHMFQFQSVDMVYIDGSHTYESALADLRFWIPRTRLVICGHDYGFPSTHWLGGVSRAVSETVGIPDAVFADASWMSVVKAG